LIFSGTRARPPRKLSEGPTLCVVLTEMSVSELEADTEQCRRQVIHLKSDYRSRRDRLDALAANYESSKQLNPAQRYVALKDMIKNACTDSTNRSKPL